MLRIWVELVPGGLERLGRQVAVATIVNLGGDPLRADYSYRLSANASAYAPALNHEGVVTGHARRQSAWALVRAALDNWWATEGWRQVAAEEPGPPRLRALLEADGTVLEFNHGPWRVVRVGEAEWLLLHGAEARGRWSDLDEDMARERLLAVMAE